MIPDITLPVYNLGPIPIDPWGTLVCIGFVLGLEVARARGMRLGLDVRDVVDSVVCIVLSGFVVGHLVHVLAYHPEQMEKDGVVALLKIWAGFSSFGGFIGAMLGAVLFFRVLRPRPFWKHADVVMFGFPFGWIFGRLGCFLARDHIGAQTDFFLGQSMSMTLEGRSVVEVRHNLGLYEALFTMVIAAAFLLADRRPRKAGFYSALWCLMYAPARFGFDFLRNTDLNTADVRWAGLTPAQWGCILMFAGGVYLMSRFRGPPAPEPTPEEQEEPPRPSLNPAPYNRTERRNWFRIPAPPGCQAILHEDGDLVRVAPILDISAGGMALEIAADAVAPEDLRLGMEISRLELRLSGEAPMLCEAVVRNLRPNGDAEYPGVICGVELVRVSASVRNTLIHYIMRRERTMLQNRRAVRARCGEGEPVRILVGDLAFKVRDLSSSGAAMLADLPTGWEMNGVIPAVRLEIPGEDPIKADARVARIEDRPPHVLYGVAFQRMSETDVVRLERWVRQRASTTHERPHG